MCKAHKKEPFKSLLLFHGARSTACKVLVALELISTYEDQINAVPEELRLKEECSRLIFFTMPPVVRSQMIILLSKDAEHN